MGQTAQAQSMDDWAAKNIAGSFADSNEAASKLKAAAEHCHLIGGVTVCPMPEGYEVQIVVVPINKERTYAIKGQPNNKGIGKSTLMTLATAAGVEWTVSRRVDDGRDPRFCHWHVEGRYPLIDGTFRTIEGDRDIDLREGADQIAGKSANEVGQLRQNLVRNAITKSKLRALREGFGVDQGMPIPELEKPFVFAKAVFTGRSSDPRIRRMFAAVIAQKQLLASQALFGGPSLPSGPPPVAALPTGFDIDEPPGMGDIADSSITEDGEVIDMPTQEAPPTATPIPAPPAPPTPPQTTQRQPPPRRSSEPRRSSGDGVWPWEPRRDGDPGKGTPLSEVDDRHLERLAKYYDENPGDERWAAKNAALASEARDIVASRQSGGSGPIGDGWDDPNRY